MSADSDETIPQIALFIQESSVRPPPPPPATSGSLRRTASRAPRPMILPLQHLPPPPPPPPPVVLSTTTSQIHNTVYRAQSPQPSTSYAICHPPPAVPEFDARRPPPPIPTQVQQSNNTLKRSNSCTAGPCKLRKTEAPQAEDALCDACVQREISIENYRIKMEKIGTEDECQILLFKKKLTEYQRQKEILRSLVDGDIFRKVEEFGEDVPPYNFRVGPNNLNDLFLTGPTSSNKINQKRLQFMEFLFSESSNFETSSSSSVEDSLRQTFSTMTRSPVRRSSPDLLQTLKEILYNEASVSVRPGSTELSTERVHSSVSNGMSNFRQYSNGQQVGPRTPSQPAPLPPPVSVPAQQPPAPVAPPASAVPYPNYPPPRVYYPPPYMPEPTPSTSRAPVPPYPPYPVERYPSPYYYYQ